VTIILSAETVAGGDDRCGQSGKFLFLSGPPVVIFVVASIAADGDDRCGQRRKFLADWSVVISV